MTNQPIILFSDGGAKGNPGPGGWGAIVVTPDGHVTELGGGMPHTTNNQMELTGAIRALESLGETPGAAAVYTDSTYVIKGISEWIWAWRRRGWKTAEGGDVLNRELWERLSRAVESRERVMGRGTKAITWHYVRGHTGVAGNERVDEIATAFGLGKPCELYDGPLAGYALPILDVPDETDVPKRKPGSAPRSSKQPAFSYLSVVDGRPMRHTTWAECERRVKGRPGALFKKAVSRDDEVTILRGWRVNPDDL